MRAQFTANPDAETMAGACRVLPSRVCDTRRRILAAALDTPLQSRS